MGVFSHISKILITFAYMKAKLMILSLTLLVFAGCGNKEKSQNDDIKQAQKQDLPIDTALQSRVKKFAEAPRCQGKFGVYVYDLTADKPVYAYKERDDQPSASCMKLLSGVAGLHLLGTNYKYVTSLYTKGNLQGDNLHGDIAFKGGLDPQLKEQDLSIFAKQLHNKGIRKFDGKLYVDLVLKDPVASEPHWYPWDLSFSSYGVLYKGADRLTKYLKMALRNNGIQFKDSQVVLAGVPKGSRCIYRYYRSIDMVIERMWKNSSNTQATSLLFTIGNKSNPKAEPTKAGVNYMRYFLKKKIGVKDTNLMIHDGCGLCTHNHLSPYALVEILKYGYEHPSIYKQLRKNLAIAGVDGTLRKYWNPAIKGKVRGKTGTLSHPYGISSLAGYCDAPNGHVIAFAIMDSEMSVLDAHVIQRKLMETLTKEKKK